MKSLLKSISLFVLMMSMAFVSYSQDKGHLKMEITEVSSDNPQIQAQAEMMKGSVTEVYYDGKKSLTDMNMMGGMIVTKILMEESGDMKLIMDMMGQKMLIPMSKMELEKAKATGDNPMSELDITYDESDTKEIAGFSCYKMVAKPKTNPDMAIEAYITEDIKANAGIIQGVDIGEFKGFPLEYTVDMGMMKMTTTAKEYKDSVDSSVFEVNTNGYTEMTLEEFMESMGAMGGGFGF